jgi:XTP/dITP diphosphohydrolase
MTELLIATSNQGKLREYAALLAELPVTLLTPGDIGLAAFDVEETAETFEGNAILKAEAYAAASGRLALADDSGLAVDALGGLPGVYSARYAEDDAARIDKLLRELADVPDEARTARFACVVALAQPTDAAVITARGTVEGRIAHQRCEGEHGFGYDPIFIPDGYTECLAALPLAAKNLLSHRGNAIRALLPTLREHLWADT